MPLLLWRTCSHVTCTPQQRELQQVGQQVAAYCSSAGIDLSKLQTSSWALAETNAAVATFLFQVLASFSGALGSGGAPIEGTDSQMFFLQQWGISAGLAQRILQSVFAGRPANMQDLLLAAFVMHPGFSTYLQQLEVVGQALSSLPVAAACNNPKCVNLTGSSEQEIVGGLTCRCSGCKLAFYCGRDCQRAQWGAHKAVCKAVQAKRASGSAGV